MIDPEAWSPSPGIILDEVGSAAVGSKDSLLVLAGPGSGKTELLAQRAMFLLQTGSCPPPRRILAISFKVDAAATLKQRVRRRCGASLAGRFDSFTFDAFAKSLVDRFRAGLPDWCRPKAGYQVVFPTEDDWLDFVRGLPTPPAELGTTNDLFGTKHASLSRFRALPAERPTPKSLLAWAYLKWLEEKNARNELSFPLIRTLATTVTRHNAQVTSAIRLTYSHVFLDEYQDTTKVQFDFIKELFAGTPAVVTAVGDTKQRIMTFAGAEKDVFQWAKDAFSAPIKYLSTNHRSSEPIVELVNAVATMIDADAVPVETGAVGDGREDWSSYQEFDTDDAEAEWIARTIAEGLGEGLSPSDFAILVRNRVDQAESQVHDAFIQHRIPYLNESRRFGGIAVGDIIAEPVTHGIQALFCLAVGERGPVVYDRAREFMESLNGSQGQSDFDEADAERHLRRAVANLADFVRSAEPADAASMIDATIAEIGENAIRKTYPSMRGSYFAEFSEALRQFSTDVGRDASNWVDLAKELLGGDKVRLLTIHKSKGLEFHTVIFLGVHARAFRNLDGDEMNTFFVALSRAKERVFFTRSAQSGGRQARLLEVLRKAGVAGA